VIARAAPPTRLVFVVMFLTEGREKHAQVNLLI